MYLDHLGGEHLLRDTVDGHCARWLYTIAEATILLGVLRVRLEVKDLKEGACRLAIQYGRSKNRTSTAQNYKNR